jgi:hypothetical protein
MGKRSVNNNKTEPYMGFCYLTTIRRIKTISMISYNNYEIPVVFVPREYLVHFQSKRSHWQEGKLPT